MKFQLQLSSSTGAKTHSVEVQLVADRWHVALDGKPVQADVVEIAPNTLSVLLAGQSHEIRISGSRDGRLNIQTGLQEFTAEVADPRSWRGRRSSHVEAEGRQQVVAPMAGKVVRVLVRVSDQVEAAQGLLVVEAMKMQNEIRSPKKGTVERLTVVEGQAVNAGDVLAWIS
jgi:biotin carboxyl carrier protein